MRIVFMGSPDFAIPSLEALHESEHKIAAVVSNVDKRRGRRAEPSPTVVKKKALEFDLPVIEVEELDDADFYRKLESLNADLFVVVAFRILPKKILDLPSKGSINLHASLLPKYRGAAPIHWALINGEEKTGCTVFLLDEQVDTGKIILQKETPIDPEETTGDLYSRLKAMGSDLIVEAVNKIENNSYQATAQDHNNASPAPKLFTADCKIDFDKPAQEVHDKIRGLSPFPTAWAILDGAKFNIYRSALGPSKMLPPGKLLMHQNNLIVGCKSGTLILSEVQQEGKRRMSGKDFMNGYNGAGILK